MFRVCKLPTNLAQFVGPGAAFRSKFLWKGGKIRGRCYDRNFLRFLPIFGEQIGVFLKNQCYDHFFAKINSNLSKKRQIFLPNFSTNFFLFKTSDPGSVDQGLRL
jgi:hypothetical protein